MSLSKEQLLQKRVVCTGHEDNHYPGSLFLPGQILYEHKAANNGAIYYSINSNSKILPTGSVFKPKVENHPHLFRVLTWYEGRKIDEMPYYLKRLGDGKITYTAVFWQPVNNNWDGFLPATREDYENYLQTNHVFTPGQQAE